MYATLVLLTYFLLHNKDCQGDIHFKAVADDMVVGINAYPLKNSMLEALRF